MAKKEAIVHARNIVSDYIPEFARYSDLEIFRLIRKIQPREDLDRFARLRREFSIRVRPKKSLSPLVLPLLSSMIFLGFFMKGRLSGKAISDNFSLTTSIMICMMLTICMYFVMRNGLKKSNQRILRHRRPSPIGFDLSVAVNDADVSKMNSEIGFEQIVEKTQPSAFHILCHERTDDSNKKMFHKVPFFRSFPVVGPYSALSDSDLLHKLNVLQENDDPDPLLSVIIKIEIDSRNRNILVGGWSEYAIAAGFLACSISMLARFCLALDLNVTFALGFVVFGLVLFILRTFELKRKISLERMRSARQDLAAIDFRHSKYLISRREYDAASIYMVEELGISRRLHSRVYKMTV